MPAIYPYFSPMVQQAVPPQRVIRPPTPPPVGLPMGVNAQAIPVRQGVTAAPAPVPAVQAPAPSPVTPQVIPPPAYARDYSPQIPPAVDWGPYMNQVNSQRQQYAGQVAQMGQQRMAMIQPQVDANYEQANRIARENQIQGLHFRTGMQDGHLRALANAEERQNRNLALSSDALQDFSGSFAGAMLDPGQASQFAQNYAQTFQTDTGQGINLANAYANQIDPTTPLQFTPRDVVEPYGAPSARDLVAEPVEPPNPLDQQRMANSQLQYQIDARQAAQQQQIQEEINRLLQSTDPTEQALGRQALLGTSGSSGSGGLSPSGVATMGNYPSPLFGEMDPMAVALQRNEQLQALKNPGMIQDQASRQYLADVFVNGLQTAPPPELQQLPPQEQAAWMAAFQKAQQQSSEALARLYADMLAQAQELQAGR